VNHYPAWKYLLLIAVISFACIYAAPNLYGEDPAVQISSANDVLTPSFTTSLENTLKKQGLVPTSTDADQSRVLMRFSSGEEQLQARDALIGSLDKDDYTVALNLAPATPNWLRDLNANPMYLGLDLRGGIHFLMQVDMKGAITGVMESYASDIRTNLREDKIRNRGTRAEGEKLRIRFTAIEKREAALAKLKPLFKDLQFAETEDEKGFHLLVSLRPEAIIAEKKLALTQNITALRNRVNSLGVSEPVIQQQGLDRIVVQLPGVQDSAKAREILGSTATLEYRMQHGTYQEGIAASESGRIPVGAKLFQHREGYPVLLNSNVIVTGENIQNAVVSYDENNQPAVSITLDSKGADKMLKNTKENTKKPMAVIYKETKFDTKIVNGKKRTCSTHC
jgi:preprotein translocase subunit SecD